MKKIILMCIAIVLLTGCKPSVKSSDNDKTIIEILTSEQANGRLTGTQGNKYIETFISKYFSDLGLEYYTDETYLNSYEQDLYDSSKQTSEMWVRENDTKKELTYGIDFLQSTNMDCSISNKLIVSSELENEDAIVLLENLEELHSVLGNIHTKAVLKKEDNFKRYLQISEIAAPIIQISPEIYDELIGKKDAQVYINLNNEKEVVFANNIIGKISGTDHKKALIISAHFDHVGSVGENYFRGALDNASGIYVLLELAKRIQEHSKSNPLPIDILFCAFNGEESGQKGSKEFAKQVKDKYLNIININVDSVGTINSKGYELLGDEQVSKQLIEKITAYMNEKEIHTKVVYGTDLVSDHLSFSEIGIPSISIGDQEYEVIHSLKDTTEMLDENRMSELMQAIVRIIIEKSDDLLEVDTSITVPTIIKDDMVPIDEEHIRFIEEQRSTLTYGQYRVIEYNGVKEIVHQFTQSFEVLQDFTAFYGALKISDQLEQYRFDSVSVLDFSMPQITVDELIVDEIYTKECSVEDIASLDIRYVNENIDEGISIGFRPIENPINMKEFPLEDASEEMVTIINDSEFSIIYDKDSREISDISTISKDGSVQISILKGKPIEVDFEGETIKVLDSTLLIDKMDEVEAFVNSTNVNEVTNYIELVE